MLSGTIVLHANFRMTGWRWPFRLGDVLEVWRGEDLVGELSVELLISLVTHYMVGHDLLRRFDAAVIPAAVLRRAPLVKLPATTITAPGRAVRDADYRATLRTQRRARRRPAPGS